jgi:DNA-binding IclR family transcriptional regulator
MSGDSVSVPAKLLSLLDAFNHGRSVYTLSELARRTGLPLTTAHRLVGELERWGGLERGADGQYRIGLRMVELAALCPRGVGLRDIALPYMQDLYEATHQNVQLAVREGTDGVYIERIAGREAVAVRTRIGARWPLHATGVGLVLLRRRAVRRRRVRRPRAGVLGTRRARRRPWHLPAIARGGTRRRKPRPFRIRMGKTRRRRAAFAGPQPERDRCVLAASLMRDLRVLCAGG